MVYPVATGILDWIGDPLSDKGFGYLMNPQSWLVNIAHVVVQPILHDTKATIQ
jgi:hypothetical protein